MAYIGKIPAAAALTADDITDGIISNAKLAQDIISADTALAVAPAATDELLISDAGTLKRIDYSLIPGSGRILNTEEVQPNNSTTINSTSWTDTTLTDTITPSSTSSKILLMYGWESKNNNSEGYGTRIERAISGGATTNVGATDIYNFWVQGASGIELRWHPMLNWLDSPSTTSEITYTIQAAGNNTNTLEWIAKRMILLEIGG